MQSCIPAMMWWWCGGSATSYPNEVLGSTPQTWLKVWPHHTYSVWPLLGVPKIPLYCMEYNRPMTQLGCLPYWFAEEHNCDMHPHSTKSHYVKYAGSVTSDYRINTISSCVLFFHCHHQWIYWRRFWPKWTLYGWLWGYGIWCYTIDSRCGAKFIYNKDQHANTYVNVWGYFPVGKIWSSHSIIKSRFDMP